MVAGDVPPSLLQKNLNRADDYRDFIKEKEGKRLTAYPDAKGFSIGYGRYGANEGDTITDQQAEEYLEEDINKRIVALNKNIPGFDDMPLEARQNMLGSWYRGSLSGSPKTIRLINEGNYVKASKEFLNNDEYRNPDTAPGIKKRMEATAKAIREMA
jgi:GH24 family phage-related lysozyme (muramidase)